MIAVDEFGRAQVEPEAGIGRSLGCEFQPRCLTLGCRRGSHKHGRVRGGSGLCNMLRVFCACLGMALALCCRRSLGRAAAARADRPRNRSSAVAPHRASRPPAPVPVRGRRPAGGGPALIEHAQDRSPVSTPSRGSAPSSGRAQRSVADLRGAAGRGRRVSRHRLRGAGVLSRRLACAPCGAVRRWPTAT